MGFSFHDERDEMEGMDQRLREGLDAIPVRELRRDEFDWRVVDALRPNVPWYHHFFDVFWFERRPGTALIAVCAAVLVLMVALLVTHVRSVIPMTAVTPPLTNGSTSAAEWLTQGSTPQPAAPDKHTQDRSDAGIINLH